MTQTQIFKALELYAQGMTIERSTSLAFGEAYTMSSFLQVIEENNFGQRWQLARDIRKVVVDTAKKSSIEIDIDEIYEGLRGEDVDQEQEVALIKEYESRILKQEAEVFYLVSLAQHTFMHTLEPLVKCIDKVGLDEGKYYVYLASHPSLSEAHSNAISRREQIYLPKLQADKLQLLDQLMTSILDQSNKDNYTLQEITEKKSHKQLINSDGDVVGEKLDTDTVTRHRQMKVPSSVLKLGFEVIGITKSEDKIVPESVVKLETITTEEVEKRREEYRKKIREAKKNMPKRLGEVFEDATIEKDPIDE